MPVDPTLVPILEASSKQPPPDPNASIEQLRDQLHGVMEQLFVNLAAVPPEPADVRDTNITVDGGEIAVRIYTPAGDGRFPAHLFFHGGAFWLGTLESFDAGCREICVGAECVVVSVDYRLAPEHKFPTAAEDCYAALLWTVAHADELRIDTSRVSVGGNSAGGDLAAVVALMARDRRGPSLVLQVLEVPVTDLTMSQPSVHELGEGYLLTRTAIELYVNLYLDDPADAKSQYASPLQAPDVSGLPPAVVMTAEYDPLRGEGEAYAARLRDAGVPVTMRCWEGHVHGSNDMTALVPSARDWRNAVIAAMRAAYARS